MEQEIEDVLRWQLSVPVIVRYVERKVYKPMPPTAIEGPVMYIDRPVDRPVPVEKIVTCWSSRSAGFFGRMGDKIDRLLGLWRPDGS